MFVVPRPEAGLAVLTKQSANHCVTQILPFIVFFVSASAPHFTVFERYA